MKLVVLGAGDIGVGLLKGLTAGEHSIVGVLPWESLHSAKGTRGMVTRLKRRLFPDMAHYAATQGWPLLKPASANSDAFAGQVRALAPDLIVVAGWGEVLRETALSLPTNMVLNCHPSLLPAHRGADPIGSVLRAGESRTGITFHQMTPALDAGPIILQSEFPIESGETYSSLARKMSHRAAETVLGALRRLAETAPTLAQDEALASYWPRGGDNDRKLDWQQPAAVLVRQVRAASPGRPAYSWHGERLVQVLAAEPGRHLNDRAVPGEVVFRVGAHVCVAAGVPGEAVWLTRISTGPGGEARGRLHAMMKLKPGELLGKLG